jgi:hypothetical protein
MEIVVTRSAGVLMSSLLLGIVAGSCGRPAAKDPPSIRNPDGLQLVVANEHASPTLRIVLPGAPASERAIEVIFPEHVTAVRHGSVEAEQLYRWRPGPQGDRPVWRRRANALEYERDLPGAVHLLARATLEADGVRFRYEFRNASTVAYDLIYAVTDPRLTGDFQDLRLERTYVHYLSGFALIAAETPTRLTMPLERWLPARYLASFTWPVPTQRVERRSDGITYYNTARAVDQPFIATRSADGAWVVASFARNSGNVWTNPELTCQHVDPQTALPPGQAAVLEIKILVLRGSLEDALRRALAQRDSLR